MADVFPRETFSVAKREGKRLFSQATLGRNNGFTLWSWSTRKLNLSRNSRPHLGYAQQQQNNKHMEFGEISRKVWQNVKWDGKRGPWKVAILTKMVNWQKRSSPFSNLLSYIPQTHGKFPLDSPFSSNLPLYKECILTFEYTRQPLGKFHHIFNFHQGSI